MSTGSARQTVTCHAPAARPRWRRWLAVALVIGLAAGCTRLLLAQLDWVAVLYVDSYFSLTERQEAIVRDGVRRNVATFRTRDVPDFLRVLGGLRADLAGPVTPALVDRRVAELEALGQRVATLLVPDSVVLLRSMSGAQVDELFATLVDNTAELADEYSGMTLADRRERQARQVLKFTRRMTGSLSSGQQALVRRHVGRFHDVAPQWIDRRQAWQQALRTALDGARNAATFERQVASLILDPNQFDPAGYRAQVAHNRQVLCEMVAELSATLTPAQRASVDRRIREYERTLVGLTAT